MPSAKVFRCRIPSDQPYDGVHASWHYYHPDCCTKEVQDHHAETVAVVVAVSLDAPCDACEQPLYNPDVTLKQLIEWEQQNPDSPYFRTDL